MCFRAIFLTIPIILMTGCTDYKDCNSIEEHEKLIQSFDTDVITAHLLQIDSGAFGFSTRLRICNSSNKVIEEIGLRGEDYLPSIDSIVKKTVYIHYSLPSDEAIEFEDVVLGDALLKRESLKYKYIFKNKR